MYKVFERKLSSVIAILMAVLVFFGSTSAAVADVNSNMNNFWSDSVGMANASGPSAYQGQSYGYYTFGNVSTRASMVNTTLGGVQLPTVKAGCGGIDIFAGGFSFINSDQLVATLKAVAQNAVGLLFEMAIDSLSELMGSDLKSMFNELRNITNQNINSCQAAQSLISGITNTMVSADMKTCMESGINNGTYSDYADAFAKCGAGGQAENMADAASPGGPNSTTPGNRNIAWEALKKNPIFQNDTDMSEAMMTITGTAITSFTTDPNTGAKSPHVTLIPPEGQSDAMIGALMDGGAANPIEVFDCSPDPTNCLTIASSRRTININTASALKPRINALLNDMVARIIAKQTLTAEEQALMGMVTIPLYKIASVQVAYQRSFASVEMQKYTDAIATDLVIKWLRDNIDEVNKSSGNLAGLDEHLVKEWHDNLNVMMQRLDNKETIAVQKMTAVEQIVQRTQEIESIVNSDTTSQLSQAYLYLKNMKSAG